MRMKALLACSLLILAAVAAAAPPHKPAKAELPATLAIPPFSMQYQVLRNGWHMGDARFTLERDGDVWQFRSEAAPAGLAALFIHSTWSESSRFRV
ncbi:MAG TPA: hypothetical protein VFX38_00095, partial [Gammaproteobacteria bacterium]|nr:hypothetical protein [Gammaproteobacteria bacterium]